MKISSILFIFLLVCTVTVASAQRRRGRVARPAVVKPVTTPTPQASPAPVPPPAAPVAPTLMAIVNGQNITTADLAPRARQEVESLPARIADARVKVLEMETNTALLDNEAKRRRLTAQQLYDLEVTKKITAPTQVEIDVFVERNRQQIAETDPAVLREQVGTYLRGERETKLAEALVSKLQATNPVVKGVDVNTPNLAPAVVLVTVGGRPITAGRINERLKPIIYKLRRNNFFVGKQALDVTINDMLLLAEASRRNVAPEEMVRKEVTDKVQQPTEAEVAKFYEENKGRLNGSLESLRGPISEYLVEQNRLKLERELSDRLRKGANIKVLVSEPEPPVQVVSVDDDPSRGDANAPVTVVVFTDFQCPSCAATHPVIEDVLKSYGNRVRLVVRDFPLNRHVNARKAAEAANAAHAQGKFFEYAALLFKRQSALDVASLKKYATEVGLNRALFDAALDSGKYAAEVRHDIVDGEIYGVDSTPTIFVNGVALGSLEPEVLRAAIDRGLNGPKAAPKASQ